MQITNLQQSLDKERFSKLVIIGKNSSEKELEANLQQLLVKVDKT